MGWEMMQGRTGVTFLHHITCIFQCIDVSPHRVRRYVVLVKHAPAYYTHDVIVGMDDTHHEA